MIEYKEESLSAFLGLPFRIKGSVAGRAGVFAVPSALLALFLVGSYDIFYFIDPELARILRDSVSMANQSQISVLWAASTAVLVVLLGFRTNRAMARFWEGTGLLHQMRGEWFDSVSCCVTFSRAAQKTKPEKVMEFRHTIVRLMSLCHGCALEEISLSDGEDLETIDTMGLDDDVLQHLKLCKEKYDFNRVEVLLHLIQSLITVNLDDGILLVAPPILSRVYQTLSRGFVNLLNAKKIADTRFPFPYAQTIAVLLFVNTILTPVLVSCLVHSPLWAPVFTFVPIFGMFSLNFIGVELENPFGDDDNDLPLYRFQSEMNKCLMLLLQENADLLPGVHSTRCIKDFNELQQSLKNPAHLDGGAGRADMHNHQSEETSASRMSAMDNFNSAVSGLNNFVFEDHKKDAEELPRAVEPEGGAAKAELLDAPEMEMQEVTVPAGLAELVLPPVGQFQGQPLSFSPAYDQSICPDRSLALALDFASLNSDMVIDLDRALGELQRLLDDELLQDLGRSCGSLRLFCDAIPAVLEALGRPASTGPSGRAQGERGKAAGAMYLDHGGPRLSGHRPNGLELPQQSRDSRPVPEAADSLFSRSSPRSQGAGGPQAHGAAAPPGT